MSKRIKELIEQASSWGEVACEFGTDNEYQLDVEKFAKLILDDVLNTALYSDEFEQARANVKRFLVLIKPK